MHGGETSPAIGDLLWRVHQYQERRDEEWVVERDSPRRKAQFVRMAAGLAAKRYGRQLLEPGADISQAIAECSRPDRVRCGLPT